MEHRPTGITPEEIEAWEKRMRASHDLPRHIITMILTHPETREKLLAGYWIDRELKKLECPTEIRQRITCAFGQKATACETPWTLARRVMRAYKKGMVDVGVPVIQITLGGKDVRFIRILPRPSHSRKKRE